MMSYIWLTSVQNAILIQYHLLYTTYWNFFVREFKSPKRWMKWYFYRLLIHSVNITLQDHKKLSAVLQRMSERTTGNV